jgi:hypothetical protein
MSKRAIKEADFEDRLLTFPQLHERWGGKDVSARSVWRWIKQRKLSRFKIGGRALFRLTEILVVEEKARI